MKFIKLHSIGNKIVHVNIEHINLICFGDMDKTVTTIYMSGNDIPFHVKELPSDIINMIKEEE